MLRASGLAAADLGEAGWLLQSAAAPAESMSAAAAADAQFRLFEAVSRCLGRLADDLTRVQAFGNQIISDGDEQADFAVVGPSKRDDARAGLLPQPIDL